LRINSKDLYGKLFNGSEADLILTDKNNLLDTCVDIYAQFPAKKLKNISLCSDGGRALTAIALLFMFWMK
jgi:chromosome segregation protein